MNLLAGFALSFQLTSPVVPDTEDDGTRDISSLILMVLADC